MFENVRRWTRGVLESLGLIEKFPLKAWGIHFIPSVKSLNIVYYKKTMPRNYSIFDFIDNLEDRDFANWYSKELKSCHEFCRCNMFICKREIMNKYCECLFQTMAKMDPKSFTRRKRIMGFIGEYFMGFWFRYYGYKIAYKLSLEYDKSLIKVIRRSV